MPLEEASYVDDQANVVAACTPSLLIEKLAKAASVIYNTYAGYGLLLNMKDGKTEAVVRFRGPGSKEALLSLAVGSSSKLAIKVHGMPDTYLKVVNWYKHMGSIVYADGRTGPETAQRTASAYNSLTRIRSVLKMPQLPLTAKSLIVKSLIHSRLTYNIHVLGDIKSADWRNINTAYHYPLRVAANMVTRSASDAHYTNEEVRRCCKVPPAYALVAANTISYIARLAVNQRTVLWRLIALTWSSRGGWSRRVKQIFKSLHAAIPSLTCSMPDPDVDPDEWIKSIFANPKQWKGAFAAGSVKKLDIHQCGSSLHSGGASGLHVLHPADEVQCQVCGNLFLGRQALRCHQTHAHGFKNPFRQKIMSTECFCCGRDFHSARRIHIHVAFSSKRCRDAYAYSPDADPDWVDRFWHDFPDAHSKALFVPPNKR